MNRFTRRHAAGSPVDSADSASDAPHAGAEDRDGISGSEAVFLRGLSLGALIGAVIAGSAIWERRRMRRAGGPAAAPETEDGPAAEAEPGPGA